MPTDPVNREPLCRLLFYRSVKEPKSHGKEIPFSQILLEEEANRIRMRSLASSYSCFWKTGSLEVTGLAEAIGGPVVLWIRELGRARSSED